MRILSIESSSRNSSVAIVQCTKPLSVDKSEILFSLFSVAENQDPGQCEVIYSSIESTGTIQKTPVNGCSTSLIPLIKSSLNRAGLKPVDLDLISVALGPGSFTSLRMGVVAAKTIAFALNRPAVGIDVMDALACQAMTWHQAEAGFEKQESVSVALNVGRGEVLALDYQVWPWLYQRVSQPRIYQPAQWLAAVGDKFIVTGDGIGLCADRPIENVVLVSEGLRTPTAVTVAKLGFYKFLTDGGDDFWKLEPIYSRPSTAEEVKSKCGMRNAKRGK